MFEVWTLNFGTLARQKSYFITRLNDPKKRIFAFVRLCTLNKWPKQKEIISFESAERLQYSADISIKRLPFPANTRAGKYSRIFRNIFLKSGMRSEARSLPLG